MSEVSFECAGESHVGMVRKVNEDAWLSRPDLGLWAVADGMGGHQRGDLASRMLIETLGRVPVPGDARALREAVEAALVQVNERLRALAGPQQLIGTTVVMLLIYKNYFAVLWAGDSRAYRWNGMLEPLTRDHSLVQELIDRGELMPHEVEHHPLRNVVGRAIGADAELELEAVHGELRDGDLFLLCSDGLTKHLSDGTIAASLNGDAIEANARRLVQATLDAGASDNVTVLLVRIRSESASGQGVPPPNGSGA
jgi:serine/threonine protein phosphatase PrpC